MMDQEIKMALTFDDLLLIPAESTILPKDVDTRTSLTNNIIMNMQRLWDCLFQAAEAA